jgi:3-phenylpropionate/trans-cinnamate dioxygenase ferredoxin reductase subunit
MNHSHVKYLLIGGGVASSAAAAAIRQRDSDGAATLVGQEIFRPYNRPPLSKEHLRGQKSAEAMFTLEPDWFTKNHVTLRTGVQASHLDTGRSAITLSSGEEISFDALLIATGASPVHLSISGANLPNVHYLRNFADAQRLHHAIDQARREGRPHGTADSTGRRATGRACVIGGGVLGVEVAASLTQMGLGVDLVVAASHPWSKFAGENTGRFIVRFLEQHGVSVHLNAPPQRLDGDGRVQRVVLGDGRTVQCDFVIAAIGAAYNRELLRSTPIRAQKAILTDDHCQTSVEGIYAAGDCAAIFDPLFGKHRVMDHWDSAIVTGALAGANMAGANRAYDAVNYFFSDVFDLSL